MKEYYLPGKEKIYYRKNIFKKRKTIVFIHGLSGSSSAWMPYEEIFKETYNLISIDLRGHGKSFRPKGQKNYVLHKFSEDVYHVLKHEKISNCIIISHSFGSIILFEFLKTHKKMVSSIVLISASCNISKRIISKLIKPLYNLGEIYNIGAIFPLQKERKHINYDNYRNTGDWNLKRMYADIKNTGIHNYLNSLKNTYYFNGEKTLKEIDIPVLIIHGEKDTIFLLEHTEEMHKLIKNSKLKIIENANHMVVLNNIKELSKMITNFVGKTTSSKIIK